jgi:hypothetical protein
MHFAFKCGEGTFGSGGRVEQVGEGRPSDKQSSTGRFHYIRIVSPKLRGIGFGEVFDVIGRRKEKEAARFR